MKQIMILDAGVACGLFVVHTYIKNRSLVSVRRFITKGRCRTREAARWSQIVLLLFCTPPTHPHSSHHLPVEYKTCAANHLTQHCRLHFYKVLPLLRLTILKTDRCTIGKCTRCVLPTVFLKHLQLFYKSSRL